MADQENRDKSYGSLLAAAAPAFAVKSVVGDVPKAAIEHAVTSKTLGSRKSLGNLLSAGIKGRGMGRMAGGAIGIATAPLFLKGTSLLESKKDGDKAKGLGYVAGSTAAFMGAEGFLERFMEARAQGANPLTAASKGAFLGAVRSGYKVPMSIATALSVAAGRKDSDKHPAMKYVMPIATGATVGGLSRAIETAAEEARGHTWNGKMPSMKTLRHVGASGLGGAAGGVVGGLVLAKIVDALSPHKKKTAGAISDGLLSLLSSLPTGSAIEEGARRLPSALEVAQHLPSASAAWHGTKHLLHDGYFDGAIAQHVLTGAGYGYKPQATLAGKIVGSKALRSFQNMHNVARAQQFGMGIQEGLVGKSTPGVRATVAANYGFSIGGSSPELLTNRMMGISLGRSLRDIAPEQRERHLRKMQKWVLDHPATMQGAQGEANPLTVPMLGGISMALGERPIYSKMESLPTFQKLHDKLLYSGRGHSTAGLPTQLGELDKAPGYWKQNLGSLATIATVPVVALGAPALAGHGLISAGKNMVVSTPAAHGMLQRASHGGLKYGLFPNAVPSKMERAGQIAAELLVSPATTSGPRGIKPIARAIRDDMTADAVQHARDITGDIRARLRRPDNSAQVRAVTTPLALGAGLGLYANALAKSHGTTNKKKA